jgi:hypothetical protein
MADWTDWLGAGLGLAGGYMGAKAGGDQTTTTTNAPFPAWLSQWGGYNQFANTLANRPYQNTVAPFTQDQYGAMDQIRAQAGGGPEQQAGSQALRTFLSGGNQNPYIGQNPYLANMVNQANDQIQNRMGTAAFNSGSFGNSGVAAQTAKAIGDSTNALNFANYNQSANLAESGLNRQAQMIPQALTYQNQNLGNASALLQSGAMQQQQGQKTLDNWWNYPMQQLDIMGRPLGFNAGQTQTQNIPGNPWASALGGGLLGLQIGSAATQTPPPRQVWGTVDGSMWR